jgi:RHH-type proline utilization regulon transcriptional repressor/proline dehydrogenase/delta 1-pyrroline-5-carboxylate dehydrogenase
MFGDSRRNSAGLNFADESALRSLAGSLAARSRESATPLSPRKRGSSAQSVTDPADRRRTIGEWTPTDLKQLPDMVGAAVDAQKSWSKLAVAQRATMLERAGDALEARRDEFLHLLVREAGKTLPDSMSELRETVDYLRFYAAQAREHLSAPLALPGPTGEHNELQLHGRGVFAAISPWNFPLAIFTGQLSAALAAGNTVLAKPAEQTNLVAMKMVEVLHESGIPKAALQLVLGEGDAGAALVNDERIGGVAFTGSVDVARIINRSLAGRDGPIAALVAETGGQNALIADSSALPEQIVKDTIASAFNAAGQRCSALRVLFVQEDIADKVIGMLRGAMKELVIGDPAYLSTDVGPVIDREAQDRLEQHAAGILQKGTLIERLKTPESCKHGTYFAPVAVEIESLSQLKTENFGAFLHVIRYSSKALERVVEQVNGSKFGLTLGVHSRIESTWRRVQAAARVGNCYINRNMIGAVVGVQPFGGEGLSGTGPKAGGPHYLMRFVTERTLTINTSAVGGNARLLAGS